MLGLSGLDDLAATLEEATNLQFPLRTELPRQVFAELLE
jgi:hypothetical protein